MHFVTRHGLLGILYAAIAIATFAVLGLIVLGPVVAAIGALIGVLFLGDMTLDRLVNSRSRFAVLRAFARDYASLRRSGEEVARGLSDVALFIVVVLGWAVIAALGVVLVTLPGLLLGVDSPAMAIGYLAGPVFFGCLLIGPLWTLRRLRR